MNPWNHISRWYDEPTFTSAVTLAVRIEVHHQIVLIDERRVDFVAETEGQR